MKFYYKGTITKGVYGYVFGRISSTQNQSHAHSITLRSVKVVNAKEKRVVHDLKGFKHLKISNGNYTEQEVSVKMLKRDVLCNLP